MDNISTRLVRGSMWITIARLLTNGLATLSMFVLAWNLAPADFGLVAIATTFILILTSVTDISLSAALVRHEAPDESHLSAAWTLNAIRGLALCLLTWAFAYPMAAFFTDDRLVPILLALGVSLLISSFANPRLAMAQRELQFRPEFLVTTGQKLIGFVVAVSVAIAFKSYWALVLGTLATQAANVLLSYLVMPFRPRILLRYWREFFAFSGWLTASQIVNTLNWRFDELLIGKLLNSTVLGYYTVGGNLASIPTRETTAPLMATIYPAFAAIRSDTRRLRDAYQRSQALVTAIALPAGVGTALLAEPIIRLTMGDKWLPAVSVVQILGVVFAFQTLGSLIQPIALSLGETRALFSRDWKLLVLRVALVSAAIVPFGLIGVLLARAVSSFVGSLVNMLLVRRLLNVSLRSQLRANLRAIASVSAMAIGVLVLSWLTQGGAMMPMVRLLLLMAAGGAIYCVTSLILWHSGGRPTGPETDILTFANKMIAKARIHPVAW
ncbi:MAG: lipopolysaccharide biosynthesis protein [Erythrobacter sp.]|nr:lipopolysaccharide biosynthesis protein [Erythrobacter sp.]